MFFKSAELLGWAKASFESAEEVGKVCKCIATGGHPVEVGSGRNSLATS